jgi:hypothetical protein
MRKLFPGLFKQEPKVTENLPDLIRKLNQTDLTKYDKRFDILEEKPWKDPLMMRINVEKLNYIKEYNNELTPFKRLRLSIKYYLAKLKPQYRYDYILHRPNEELRKPHYNFYDENKFTISNLSLFLLIATSAYFIGYIYARFRYDVYLRRMMYVQFTSFMLLFEMIDHYVTSVQDTIEYYFPREFSQIEYEFVVYKWVRGYLRRRKLDKEINLIVNTDPDIIEIDNLIKKIR